MNPIKAMLLILVSAFCLPSLAATLETDCRKGLIAINVEDQTDKEGFIRALQIFATFPLRDSAKILLPDMDPRTGERPASRITRFTLFDAFPQATPDMKESIKSQLKAAIEQLNQIPGVVAMCGSSLASPAPRMGGGF